MTEKAASTTKEKLAAETRERRRELARSLEYLQHLEHFEAALKAVRLVVFAGMTSFVILAIYGFVLIYRLTTDVHVLVGQTAIMTQQMQAMTRSMANLHQTTASMSTDVSSMSEDMSVMTGQVGRMADSVTLMQHSATNMDRQMSPIMGTMNRFMPFDGMSGYPVSPPYAR
ncbi:hypothetical protein RGUI_2713 [Rhodovulum sp. P5]|uniref:hypothetical protein n=1 Tax=Rhodovulum sp. P5 TaxID=1564506 RepID=UPI0009C1B33A|nr:hypothetical protein [Rhodovulum sp. P5]ARE40854.1 hypothetical protein RGUI_2713 [Rhodovulum sp. P5]